MAIEDAIRKKEIIVKLGDDTLDAPTIADLTVGDLRACDVQIRGKPLTFERRCYGWNGARFAGRGTGDASPAYTLLERAYELSTAYTLDGSCWRP